jgi:hypothetical protein
MLVFFAYCEAIKPSQDLGTLGYILLYAALVPTFITVCIAATRAHRAGSWPWFIAAIFAWPASYIYTLWVNRGA